MDKNNTATRIVEAMVNTFAPAQENEIDEMGTVMLLSTEELIAQMAPMMQVDKNELSRILFDAGFRFVYEAETWRWMLKRKE